MNGQLATSNDVDWYSFNSSGAGVITLRFDAPTDSAYSDYFTIRLADANGNTISQVQTGRDLTFQAAVGQAGGFFAEVKSSDYLYNGGSYALEASFSAGASNLELEPNDDKANAISSGAQIRGQLSTAEDLDWYSLRTNGASDLLLAFDAPSSSSYSNYFQVWVLDSDGNLLGSKGTGQDTTFTVGAPSADDYYIGVSTAQNYLHDSGQYGLTVTSFASNVNRESETNDTIATADPLALGSSIFGQLATSNDIDRFNVTLSSAGTLTVNFDGPTNSTWTDYFRVEVYGPTGVLMASRNTGVDTSFDVKVPASGNYSVVIAAANAWSYSAGEYRLAVSAVLEDPPPVGAITGTPLGDRLIGTTQDDLIYGLGGNDLIDGATGSDTAVFRAANSNLSINTIGGLSAVRGGYAAGEHANTASRLWNVEKIKTWTGETPLSLVTVTPLLGNPQTDKLMGTAANDLIDGLGGSDFIDGGAGADTLALFGPKDKFVVTTVAGITRIEGGEGTEEYAGHIIRTVGVETLGFTRNETRSLAVNDTAKIFGSASSDRLTGTSSDEIFDGIGGADQVDGSAGTDTLIFFGRYQDFTVTLPTAGNPELSILGKATAGKDYAGITVRANNIERLAFTDLQIDVNTPPGLVISPTSTLLTEGGAAVSVALSLSVKPFSNVTVVFNGGNQLSASAAQIIFDATNWNTPQTVAISAVDDTAIEKQHSANLTLTVSSIDPLYTAVSPSAVSYTISDNDVESVGSVKGQFWNDADKDGVVDAGEQPLAGWTVFDDPNRNGKLDKGESSFKTDSSGRYQLDELSIGAHTIVAQTLTGWSPTYPSLSGSSASIIINAPGSGVSSTGEISSTALTASAANVLYTNLGTATNIAAFHADPRFSSLNGQGVCVVVIDTGIDRDHPAFGTDANQDGIADRIVYSYDFVGSNDSDASDVDGHGTHVAGIVGSSDATYSGIAPEVNIIALRVLGDDGRGYAADILEAINWVVTNAGRYNVVAVNLSLGSSSFDQIPTIGYASTQFKALANAGVVVVSASGNSYANNPVQGVSYPSSDPYSLSVGAVWASSGTLGSQVGSTDAIAVFSQRDDTESDIFAPGVSIASARNGGGYVAFNGTSMAAPEISGMVALAQQLAIRELGRRLTFDEVRSLLKSTGDSIFDGDDENDGSIPNTGLTFYRADMLAMAEAILKLKPPVSHTVNITNGSVVENKNFGFSAGSAIQGLAADDFIVGASIGEIIRGGAGADQIDAGDGNDQIYGEAGEDRLTGGAGNDTINGGEGTDAALFIGRRADYSITWSAGTSSFSVDSVSEGADLLSNIETLTFLDGTYSVNALQSSTGAKFWKDNTKAPTETKKADAVNLTDAIAILKMIVGLNVNSNNTPLSPYQAIAADFDQSGDVGLTDAIGVLKMVVGLTAPTPTWKYYDDAKLASAYTPAQSLNPKGWTTTAAMSDTGSAESSVKLVGVLTGDVDGSWTGV
jgi:subtilisin family serine protease